MTDKVGKFPESRALDVTNTTLQAGVGSLPIIGGAAAPILGALVSAPLERRRTAWFNRIGDGLDEIEKRFEGFDPRSLSDNEEFVSAVYSTTEAAMRASTEGKRARLANVVLNIAAGRSISDALRDRFINLVQIFSEEHVLLLRIARDPGAFPRIKQRVSGMMAGGRGSVYLEEMAEHGVSNALFAVIAADLQREELIEGGFNVTMSAQGILESTITSRGDAFLDFVSSPLEG
jgi:hypothetical protein